MKCEFTVSCNNNVICKSVIFNFFDMKIVLLHLHGMVRLKETQGELVGNLYSLQFFGRTS